MNPARSNRRAFTLIEIMLVVAIMAIVLTMSYPAISNIVHRAPLSQSVKDVMEGCRKARAMAILHGETWEMRITAQDGKIEVMKSPADMDNTANLDGPSATPAAAPATYEGEPAKPVDAFAAQISDRVRVELLDVNFVDYMNNDVARVQFTPTGTCDEFTIIMSSEGEYRQVSTEPVTGIAEVESDRLKFGRAK